VSGRGFGVLDNYNFNLVSVNRKLVGTLVQIKAWDNIVRKCTITRHFTSEFGENE